LRPVGVDCLGLDIADFTRFCGLGLARISFPNLSGIENSEFIGVDIVAVLDLINLEVIVDSGFRSVAQG
jgi:hypothetical protein